MEELRLALLEFRETYNRYLADRAARVHLPRSFRRNQLQPTALAA
jgi:hypothetical protein